MAIGGPLFVPKNVPLNEQLGDLPDLNDAIRSTFQLLTFDIIIKTILPGGILRETTSPVSFYGSVTPRTPTPLEIAAHGERAWSMKDCYADIAIQLAPDSVVKYLGTQYRVMGYADYTKYGFQNFQLVLDYSGAGPVINVPNVLTTQDGDEIETQDGRPIDLSGPPILVTQGNVPITTQDGFDITLVIPVIQTQDGKTINTEDGHEINP